MQKRYSGVLNFSSVALDPIHHGQGSEGNTQILRTQDIILDSGLPSRVPFISGNSFKHKIRNGGCKFALETIGVPDGSLSKPVIDLLFSGGALTKSGSAVNLENARKISELFPFLSVCGYAAGNFMQDSKIRVGHIHLVCQENSWRTPENLKNHEHTKYKAAIFRGEEFGTRCEPTINQYISKFIKNESEEKDKKQKSQQMIYDFEVVRPGSQWFGEIIFESLTELELISFRSAIERASSYRSGDDWIILIGAKSSIGMGRMSFSFKNGLRETLSPPQFSQAEGISPNADNADEDLMSLYIDHLVKNKNEILEILSKVV